MKKLLFTVAVVVLLVPEISQGRNIVDMAGRKVTIPDKVKTVYPTSPTGDIILYTLAPEMVAGTSWNLCKEERAYLSDVYNKKPMLGGWYGKNTTGNPEVIMKAHPDFIISSGLTIKFYQDLADRIQKQTGIPVVISADDRLDRMDSTYRFLGPLMGLEARADSLADYCTQTLKEVSAAVAAVPPEKRIRVYYAEGLKGLETDPEGSRHAEVIKFVGGINVAQVPVESGIGTQGYGRATVSFEQILLWKPEVILVCLDVQYAGGADIYRNIIANPEWKNIPAVQKGRVYQIPALPFNWIDRPPSINRIIGLKWLAHLLYPDFYKINIIDETRSFYSLFYHKHLTDAEIKQVLENALPH